MRITDQERKDALAAKVLVSADLIRVSFRCTDSVYTDQTTCELNGEIWTDDILITTFASDITADIGEGDLVFQAAKDLIAMSDIEESLGMDLGPITLTMSGVSGTWLQLSQTIELLNRSVEIWRVLLDPDNWEIINAPFKIYSGVVVGGGIVKANEEGVSAVSLEVSNQFYNFQELSGFRCNQADHQRFFPNDTGFKFTSSVPRKVMWGIDS